jgi:hypothetical protein
MDNLENTFEVLLERKPSDKERQMLYKKKDALKIKENDAIWSILVVLDYYNSLYEEIPEKIEQSISNILVSAQKTAEKNIESSITSYKADLAKSIHITSSEISRNITFRNKTLYIIISFVISLLIIAFIGHKTYQYAYEKGSTIGFSQGSTYAGFEKIRYNWSNTTEGQKAFLIYQKGDINKLYEISNQNMTNSAYILFKNNALDTLSKCNGKGWKIIDNACYVYKTKDGNTYGWHINNYFD